MRETENEFTSSDLMDLMLDEEIDQRHESPEEQATQYLSVFYSLWIGWTQCQASQGPRYGKNQVGYHEDIVPKVVIGRCHVGPSSTCQRP